MSKKTTETETTGPEELKTPALNAPLVSLEDKILKQVVGDIINLLQQDWTQIYQAYRKAHIESGQEEFSFNIGFGAKLQPESDGVKVTCKLSYAAAGYVPGVK